MNKYVKIGVLETRFYECKYIWEDLPVGKSFDVARRRIDKRMNAIKKELIELGQDPVLYQLPTLY